MEMGITLIALASAGAGDCVGSRARSRTGFGRQLYMLDAGDCCCGVVGYGGVGAETEKDPVIDFRMLADRNFGDIRRCCFLSSALGLFGDYGFDSATAAVFCMGIARLMRGWCLGPGALVITVLAPISAQLIQRQACCALKVMIMLSLYDSGRVRCGTSAR